MVLTKSSLFTEPANGMVLTKSSLFTEPENGMVLTKSSLFTEPANGMVLTKARRSIVLTEETSGGTVFAHRTLE